jgi:4,5:9,10-diseco-3-hydroxy-5,9,17-trioxoandrosta-1(10),2-diene-4-oate hydrolase
MSAAPAPRTLEPEGKFVQAGGMTIHFHEFGDGPAVIGLHGGGPGATGWSNFRLNIPAFSANHRFMPVDMPQFGGSSRVPLNGPRLTRTAEVLDAFMDAIGLESADFVGNSMGGQAAMRLAINNPKRVRRLVLIGSTPVPYSGLQPQPLEGIKLLRSYYAGDGPSFEKMRAIMQALVSDQSLVTDDAVAERYEASIEPELLAMHRAGNLFHQEDLLAELNRIGCPTLLVWGQDDRMGALDVGLLMLRAIPDARMHIFGRTGHWAQVERQPEFEQLVLAFLDAGR